MPDWRTAVDRFLVNWRAKPEVIGALVCGSHVTGGATKRSDIDLHILLATGTKWRERGNRIVDGYLVEYFANPPELIQQEFLDDHRTNSWMSMIQFKTGEILFDATGDIAKLKREAGEWMSRPFKRLDDAETVQGMRYSLWDTLYNLRDAASRNAFDFTYVYHHALSDTFRMYARYLGWHLAGSHQHYRLLRDDAFRDRYLIPAFPDAIFCQLFETALLAGGHQGMLTAAERLIEHVTDRMGGLLIDGWTQRTVLPT
jgi:hypothetical protein